MSSQHSSADFYRVSIVNGRDSVVFSKGSDVRIIVLQITTDSQKFVAFLHFKSECLGKFVYLRSVIHLKNVFLNVLFVSNDRNNIPICNFPSDV